MFTLTPVNHHLNSISWLVIVVLLCVLGYMDVSTTASQGSTGDCKHHLMQSPPPLRRASLPFFAAYNPPTHTLSVLLDTPEHSEPQSIGMRPDTG